MNIKKDFCQKWLLWIPSLLTTYVVEPGEAVGDGIGLDITVKEDVIARPQVVRVQVSAQSHRHFGLVCSVKVLKYTVRSCLFVHFSWLLFNGWIPSAYPPAPLPPSPTESSNNQICMMAKYKLSKWTWVYVNRAPGSIPDLLVTRFLSHRHLHTLPRSMNTCLAL